MPNPMSDERRAFDPLGFILTGAGLASLMYGIEMVGRTDTNWPAALALCAFGFAMASGAWVHLQRSPKPLLDLSSLRVRNFSTPMLWSGIPYRIVIGSTPFLWALMFQVGFGMTPFVSGLLIIGCAAGDLSMKSVNTFVLRRFGFRNVLVVNGFLIAVFVTACAAFSRDTPLAIIVVVLVIIGMCRSLQFTSFNALAYADIPPAQMGAASSLASTFQQLSFGIGIAFGALALHGAVLLRGGVKGTLTVDDFHFAFVAIGIIALLSALTNLRIEPHAGAEVSGHLASEPG
jgi:hypothetical protein